MVETREIGVCKCCGENKSIFRDGFCRGCYEYKVQKKYVLNPKIKQVRKDAPFELLNAINDKGTNINVVELSEQFNVSKTRIYQILKKYFDIEYVSRDTGSKIEAKVKMKISYDYPTDTINLVSENGVSFEINAQELREILSQIKTM